MDHDWLDILPGSPRWGIWQVGFKTHPCALDCLLVRSRSLHLEDTDFCWFLIMLAVLDSFLRCIALHFMGCINAALRPLDFIPGTWKLITALDKSVGGGVLWFSLQYFIDFQILTSMELHHSRSFALRFAEFCDTLMKQMKVTFFLSSSLLLFCLAFMTPVGFLSKINIVVSSYW